MCKNRICMLYFCQSVLRPLKSWAQPETLREQRESLLPYTVQVESPGHAYLYVSPGLCLVRFRFIVYSWPHSAWRVEP